MKKQTMEIITVIIGIVGLIVAIYGVIKQARDYDREKTQQYLNQHHCRKIGEIEMIREKNKAIYQCDNGIYVK